jgi:hypothetical protein
MINIKSKYIYSKHSAVIIARKKSIYLFFKKFAINSEAFNCDFFVK